ncbi:RpsU-divergently transcribed [Croceicoccus estronivorus]|uniref:COQ9 family protein n=1 Tax=Croceicoccus estronivorus TaxID=1172626 RepID=UPI00082F10D4|nr:COQ9 family protein [Croceicoccus estronivorus]OCC22431.1 RpsU-divergently transcribed [Croceicoccus estronivorus]
MGQSAADLTLDEIRALLAPGIAANAAFDGWSETALDAAAVAAGVDPAAARFAFPGGPADMIGAWIDGIDTAMAAALPADQLATLPVRERIRRLVQFRLDAVAGREEAVRRALAIFAMPQNATTSLKRGWHSADLMWRLANDTASDFNHYTKRTILGGIYAATLAVFVDDESEGKAETKAFLDRRIAGIIRFEKAKMRLVPPADRHFSMARFLGRLRYPAR